jgi:hypothetical protein
MIMPPMTAPSASALAATRDWMKRETRFGAVDTLRVGLVHEFTTASGTTITRASRPDE